MSFRYKDYAHGNRPRTMTLDGAEFLRRFLLHVVPRGFMRIRHYGLLANRVRAKNLATCRRLLAEASPPSLGATKLSLPSQSTCPAALSAAGGT